MSLAKSGPPQPLKVGKEALSGAEEAPVDHPHLAGGGPPTHPIFFPLPAPSPQPQLGEKEVWPSLICRTADWRGLALSKEVLLQ